MEESKAIVVGAGFGGLAAAIRLRAKGYQVLLIDRCSAPGGRAQVFCKDGYRHDAGPTVITASFLFAELFTLHGRRLEDYVRLVELNPWYRFRFPDGSYFNYGGSVEDTLAEIRRISPADCDGYLALVEESKKIFAVGFEGLADKPFHNLGTMIGLMPSLVALGGYRSVWQLVTKYIHHPWLQRAFSVSPLLVGGNPFDTTSIYSLIHYLERKWGIQFAMGGTGALVQALAKLMDEIGVVTRYGATVEEILVEGGKARGVVLSTGEKLLSDIVVSDADAAFLYAKMLRKPALVPRWKLKFAQSSMGLFVLYFGTTRRYEEVAHHTIWFGDRYRELLEDIFHKHHLGKDFSLYVHRPTATDPSFAPPGCDSWYVLAPVPNLLSGTDWNQVAHEYADSIIKALSETMMPDLEQHVTARFHMTPLDFQDRYLSLHGAGFSIAPILRQSAWFRFHNRAEGVKNLFLVGAGTHPGAGLPGVLSSAKVLDHLIDQHESMSHANAPHAAATMKLHGKSFWFASRFLPQRVAVDAARLYAFCRSMDDLADIAVTQEKRNELVKVRHDLQTGDSHDPVVADFLALAQQYDLPRDAADWLVGTFLEDAETPMLIADEKELVRYCYGVAGTVGLMMAPILGADRSLAGAAAIYLGVAMQMTNIARDVLEDARAGRRYLPGDWVRNALPKEMIVCAEKRPEIASAVHRLLGLADEYYALAVSGFPLIPSRSRRGIAIAAAVYREIGVLLREKKCAWWEGRASVSMGRKLWVALRVLAGHSQLDRMRASRPVLDLWLPIEGLPGVR